MSLLKRIANVFRPARLDQDFEDELEFHRQMRLRKAMDQGLTPSEAEYDARRTMGAPSLAKEEMRDARVVGWVASAVRDLQHGVIVLRRDAGVSALIILVLALGIGGNAAIFTLLKAAFYDPLPYPAADRLIYLMESTGWTPSVSEYLEIRARNRTLDQIAFAEYIDVQLSGSGEPARLYAARVSASFLPLLGVNAALGRTLHDEENQAGRPRSVVLTDALWRTKFNADPGVVGRAIRLDGSLATVVGVLPPRFHFDYPTLRIPEPVDLYVAYPIEPSVSFTSSGSGRGIPVRLIARVREEATLPQAEADIKGIARVLATEFPEAFPSPERDKSWFTFVVAPLREAIVGSQRAMLWLPLGGSGVLLLIACANTAQLLLARSLRRGREVAIRAALGASRGRLIRQFFLEGLMLAVCGGVAGLVSATWLVRILLAMLPVRSPLLASAQLDVRVMAFTAAISLVSAMLFATIPAIKGSRWAPGSLTSRSVAGEGNRWRHAMIAVEGALSMFLLCGAGLVAQNLWALLSTPTGIDASNVLVMQVKLPATHQNEVIANAGAVFQDYVDRISAIPGVESAATVTGPPTRNARTGNAELVGFTEPDGRLKIVWSDNHLVSADYFRTLRIPLLAGRTFTRADAGKQITAAVVNQEFARRFGLGADIVGKQLVEPGLPITIVGMVGNVRTRGLQTTPNPELYLSSLQLSWANVYLVVRSALPPGPLVEKVKAAIGSSNAEQAVFGVQTMGELLATATAQPRFDAFLIGAFALLAVAMAAAGMYSVISCLVLQRSNEIAIRVALGAGRAAIVRSVLGSTAVWVASGLVCGLGLGLLMRGTVQTLSNARVSGSVGMYGSVVVFFFAVALAAVFLPVRRASRVNPASTLRRD